MSERKLILLALGITILTISSVVLFFQPGKRYPISRPFVTPSGSLHVSPTIIATPVSTPKDITCTSPTKTPTRTIYSKVNNIVLNKLPITFELPEGFAAFQEEGFEPVYTTKISIGREIEPGNYIDATVALEFLPTTDRDPFTNITIGNDIDSYIRSRIQNEFQYQTVYCLKLFGNEAIRSTIDTDQTPIVMGRLHKEQTGTISTGDMLIIISALTYGSGNVFDQNVFDHIVHTLRVIKR